MLANEMGLHVSCGPRAITLQLLMYFLLGNISLGKWVPLPPPRVRDALRAAIFWEPWLERELGLEKGRGRK